MIRLEEALLIFDGWYSEEKTIFCASSLYACWGFSFAGRVSSKPTETEVVIDGLDGKSRLVFDPSKIEGFEYGEPEHAPEPLRSLVPADSRHLSFLVAGVPLRTPVPLLPRDKLLFGELPPA
jgi:hypothetical protein